MFGGGIAGGLLKNLGAGILDQVLEKAGLPPAIKDAMQAVLAGAMGDYAGVSQNLKEMMDGLSQNMSPFDFCQLEKSVGKLEDAVGKLVDICKDLDKKGVPAPGGSEGGSWLMQLAEKLGDMLNDKAKDLDKKASKLSEGDSKPKDTAKFEAASKEFNMLFEAVNNAIKTIGDGLVSAARK